MASNVSVRERMWNWLKIGWNWLRKPLVRSDNFSRRHTLRFRIELAKKELKPLNAYIMQPPPPTGGPGADAAAPTPQQVAWEVEKPNINDHLKTAGDELDSANGHGSAGGRGSLERSLREVMAAERKLIAFFPDARGAGAIADLRRDILAYVPEERRAELLKVLEEVKTALMTKAPWKDDLLAVKAEVDEILVRGYRAREDLSDGIRLISGLLVVILLVLFVMILFLGTDLFSSTNGKGGMSSKEALCIGALFGGIGACLSGLMNFTVHRVTRGEYEPFASTWIRPLIGATSGILATVLVASGILNFGQAKLPSLAIAAFLLGFSERLVMGTVERLSTRAETRVSSAP